MKNGKKQILWVDDEIEYLRAHIMFLEEHNYDVARATNGNDAIVMVREKAFDLVFLDEQMPGKDGLTTLEEIKEIHSNLPVVIVTKSEEEQLMEDAMGRNISGYLTKPVNPSQILSVCKSILHSKSIKMTHFSASYVSDYGKIKAKLMAGPTPQNWTELIRTIFKWDLKLESLKDEGLEETHLNHKKEISQKFVKYVEENYLSWWTGRNLPPFLAVNSLKSTLFPALKNKEKVCGIVMAGFRLDQWLYIREFLEPHFTVDERTAWAPLPTDRLHCRSVLLAGKNTREISLNVPGLWEKIQSERDYHSYEAELLKMNMASSGLHDVDDPHFKYIRSMEDSKDILRQMDDLKNDNLLFLVVEFGELLMQLRQENSLLLEITPGETGFRELIKFWFKASNLLKILKYFSDNGRKVVLTSDHGSILVNEPVEVFCQEEQSPHPRLKTGMDISCDERHVFFIESPENFGLPGEQGKLSYALAKEHFYFTYPNKYQYFGSKFKGQMTSGGLSMEEMIVPLITLTPKAQS